jgi:aminoglycoside phosphotransferase (APT) family kinase protein
MPVVLHDPMLPGLTELLSTPPAVARPGDGWRISHVEWAPRRRCRLVHVVGAAPTQALFLQELTPTGITVRAMCPDPALPGLSEVLDARLMEERLVSVLGEGMLDGPAVQVAYRPDSRAVLAYDVQRDGSHSRIFVKVLAEGPARSAAASAAIAGAARSAGVPVPVPDMVAWPDVGAVGYLAAPGQPMSRILSSASMSASAGGQVGRQLGRLLGTVHGTPPSAEPLWTVDDELGQLEQLLAPMWHADAAIGRSAAAVLDRLADGASREEAVVLAHGAFRTGQVLVDDGRLQLVDLDTVCRSDPARDMGNALAYLYWAAIRGAVPSGVVAPLRAAFLASYADAGNHVSEPALAWWTGAALLKIGGRRYRSLEFRHWREVPQLLTCATDLLRPARPGLRPHPSVAVPHQHLPDPTDAAWLTESLRAVVPTAKSRMRVVGVHPLAGHARARRTVRCRVEGLDEAAVTPLIGKVHETRHHAFVTHENLRLLGQEVFGATQAGVPRIFCRLAPHNLVLYREVEGPALAVLEGQEAVRAAESAGRWLSTLHGSSVVLTRRVDLDHELATVDEWATEVSTAAPLSGPAVLALRDLLAQTAARLPSIHEVPVHKDLHSGHVLVPNGARGGVVVIDLDEARMGDPAIDVAHFSAYLEVSHGRRAGPIREAFLAGYGPLAGKERALRIAFYSAYTDLKIAKQLVRGSGPLSSAPGLARAAALDGVLVRGFACLAHE